MEQHISRNQQTVRLIVKADAGGRMARREENQQAVVSNVHGGAIFEVDQVALVIFERYTPLFTGYRCIVEDYFFAGMNLKFQVVRFSNDFVAKNMIEVAMGI